CVWRFRVSLLAVRRRQQRTPLFPYTTLFRSEGQPQGQHRNGDPGEFPEENGIPVMQLQIVPDGAQHTGNQIMYIVGFDLKQGHRSEEHTSELQSRENLVCRLLLEKKTAP